ncbi:delta(3,5)-Delta(2,4)-dienoyl-CoA isomerase, peroxisomal [Argentina anserina]|uniref:delta(3,5)-Delta(2,4)-dienoyl-CoA isomerase, peroxisomal n=1 Tax=Argentina anserina TaxID=57926 RepID=UPI0021764646|nr:delta(3,5)-Delta(2,4)-dienoyl-CoA isomerase, peroxisomal [Potentilla anserina]XP_050371887.1 delta(3,5)-Delta(2,4)-dienoyl-CoA isomerase, peroxisomal [Potentilla anserina]XP_050371888.1 delta(3,5)-Delta(2,4)-dienoyl-CoA isomerase, peroxisomal [Potentilla anserina]
MEKYQTLKIDQKNPNSPVFYVTLNRPNHRNALSRDFFTDLPKALSSLDQNPDANVIVLTAAGDHFCAGIDLSNLSSIASDAVSGDRGRDGERLRRAIKLMQDAVTAIERCRKPVIAAIHGACIGGGVDIVTACDVRYCSEDAFFSVKEVDLAITADLGTLQRLPGIVGYGHALELALTGRRFSGHEAKELGLVSGVFGSKQELDSGVRLVAEGIAAKSPLAVTGTKAVLQRSRDMSVEQGLDYVATWNSAMLISDDLSEAVSAHRQKRKPVFAKL